MEFTKSFYFLIQFVQFLKFYKEKHRTIISLFYSRSFKSKNYYTIEKFRTHFLNEKI